MHAGLYENPKMTDEEQNAAQLGITMMRVRKLIEDPKARARWSRSGQQWLVYTSGHVEIGSGETEQRAWDNAFNNSIPF